ncbi:hypothetical protein [Nocardia sp. XZ_19_231]|uniref:hypothetical protein n=1 Tax=Nocardia sp. XZ_19_231 TaxID=2769252 RepID=UPI00188F6040|nr:hypothetical protein [Nocardia sp. XZ_19_231]
MSGGLFRSPREDRNAVGRSAGQSMARPEFMGVGAVYAPVNHLPPALRLIVLAVCVLIGMVGCSIAWVDQQSYQPSLNICRAADENVRVAQVEPCPVGTRP